MPWLKANSYEFCGVYGTYENIDYRATLIVKPRITFSDLSITSRGFTDPKGVVALQVYDTLFGSNAALMALEEKEVQRLDHKARNELSNSTQINFNYMTIRISHDCTTVLDIFEHVRRLKLVPKVDFARHQFVTAQTTGSYIVALNSPYLTYELTKESQARESTKCSCTFSF